MADFALWSTACERAFCPAGSFLRAYKVNRRAAIEDVVAADPVAARTIWAGNASDVLRAAEVSRDDVSRDDALLLLALALGTLARSIGNAHGA
jgi:hypothetical protein